MLAKKIVNESKTNNLDKLNIASAVKLWYNAEEILTQNNKSSEITIGFLNISVTIPFLNFKRPSVNIKILIERYLIDITMSDTWILIINGKAKINIETINIEASRSFNLSIIFTKQIYSIVL